MSIEAIETVITYISLNQNNRSRTIILKYKSQVKFYVAKSLDDLHA